jgi:enterochelin esterase-like enzyme
MRSKTINSGFFIIFGCMQSVKPETVMKRPVTITSGALGRSVLADLYLPPPNRGGPVAVLLINDGQDLVRMKFAAMLDQLYRSEEIQPILCVGIHAGPQRKLEYGTAHAPDYRSRGLYAPRYTYFIIRELIPYVRQCFPEFLLTEWAFAGFSLGGLSALDISWAHPHIFKHTAVFSGSLWWRSLDQADPLYSDDVHRLMHKQIQEGAYTAGLKFFFECGTADETEDRNQNGIIDSIDDTKDLIAELLKKGYRENDDIRYLEIPGGTHDPATWAAAMPEFLKWAWGIDN